MGKNIEDLKREYKKVVFEIKEPVLDIGGGNGSFLKSQGVKRAIIIDGTSKKIYNYKYINADLTKKLPSFKKKFKTVFIMETLEHISNPLYLLAQAYDLLDNNGNCYISVPYTPIGDNLQHVCRWKLKELESQLKKLGFKTEVLEKRRRFKNLAFFLPHCWLVVRLKKLRINPNEKNTEDYDLTF